MMKKTWWLKTLAGLLLLLFACASKAATFQYTDNNCESFSMSGSGGVYTITCNAGSGGETAPSGCSLSASTTSFTSAGGTTTLTLSCTSQTDTSTTYQFFRSGTSLGAATNATNIMTNVFVPANSTSSATTVGFTARACNGTSCSSYASTSVTVDASSSGGTNLCSGYNVVSVALPKYTSQHNLNNFGGNSAFVGSFVASSTDATGKVTMVYLNNGAKGELTFSISEHQCDFRAIDNTGVNGPEYLSYTTNASGNVTYYIGSRNGLVAGKTYYLNIIPKSGSGAMTCASSNCNFAIGHN